MKFSKKNIRSHIFLKNKFAKKWTGKLHELLLHNNDFTGSMPSSICALELDGLFADCGGATPEISCSCCTVCFSNER